VCSEVYFVYFISKVILYTHGTTRAFTASLIAQTLGMLELSFYRSRKATSRRAHESLKLRTFPLRHVPFGILS